MLGENKPLDDARIHLAALTRSLYQLAEELEQARDLIHQAEALLVQARDGALRIDLIERIEAFLTRAK